MSDLDTVRRKIVGRTLPADIRADLTSLVAAVERLETRLACVTTERDTAREHAALWKNHAEVASRRLADLEQAVGRLAQIGQPARVGDR